jgi:hypothetical protein
VRVPAAALEPGLVIALVVVAVTIASVLVIGGVNRALRGWRAGLRGLDDDLLRRRTDEAPLRDEVRELVIAANFRRRRRGEEPLDVEAEVERRMADLERPER